MKKYIILFMFIVNLFNNCYSVTFPSWLQEHEMDDYGIYIKVQKKEYQKFIEKKEAECKKLSKKQDIPDFSTWLGENKQAHFYSWLRRNAQFGMIIERFPDIIYETSEGSSLIGKLK